MENLKIIKIAAKEVTTRHAKNTYDCHLYITYSLSNNTEIEYIYKYARAVPKINIPRKTSVTRISSLKEFKKNLDNWDFYNSTFPQKISVTGELQQFVKKHIPKVINDLDYYYMRDYDEYDIDIIGELQEIAQKKYGTTSKDEFVEKFIINTDRYHNLMVTLKKKAKEREEYINIVDALITEAFRSN